MHAPSSHRADAPCAHAERFHERYEFRYGKGTTNKAAPIEAMSFEVRVATKAQPLRLVREAPVTDRPIPGRGTRPVYFRELSAFHPTPVYERDDLRPGQTVAGPAIIDAPDSTMLVHPGQSARMDELRNITLTL